MWSNSATVVALHYGLPLTVFFYFLLSQGISACLLHSSNLKLESQRSRRRLNVWLLVLLVSSYVIASIASLIQTLTQKGWWCGEDYVVYYLASILAWGFETAGLIDVEVPVWYPYWGSWLIGLTIETALLALSVFPRSPQDIFEWIGLGVSIFRVSTLLCLLAVYFAFEWLQVAIPPDEERQGLLSGEPSTKASNGSASGAISNDRSYGAANTAEEDVEAGKSTTEEEDPEEPDYMRVERKWKERMNKRLAEEGNWWTYAKSFSIFLPFVMPFHVRGLQFNLAFTFVCLLAERALKLLVPRQLGIVTNALSESKGNTPWSQVGIYVLLQFLASGSGLSAIRSYLKIALNQYSYKALRTAAFNHIMNLSSDFHNDKEMGSTYSAVRRTHSLTDLMDLVAFEVLPSLIDLVVAFAYFYYLFDSYMALIIGTVTVVYLWLTTKLTRWQLKFRGPYWKAVDDEYDQMFLGLGEWQTVSYFNRIPYEQGRYHDAIVRMHVKERSQELAYSLMSVSQSLIFTVGSLAACFLAAYQVSQGLQPVGSFVTLLIYWANLISPLIFFGNMYRTIASYMADAERLLEIMTKKPNIGDKPGAKDLEFKDGIIEFDRVSFAYDERKPVLKNVKFTTKPAQTVALVGETGGGKSTILKLLFRFYDITEGNLRIDGQDVRDITLRSLRENIGVVPQSPSLFQDTLMANIRYSRLEATDEEVFDACRAAAIHDKILSFPDGYKSKPGARGVNLSGGELQRIAIARAILKRPKIVLLDEATSAVDTETELIIQESLKKLIQGKTTIVVAHRLSTVINADVIIVVHGGEIVEMGTHDELVRTEGRYHSLWTKQIFTSDTNKKTD